jgi:hypothetical protein
MFSSLPRKVQNLRQGADPLEFNLFGTLSGPARHQPHKYAEGPASGVVSPRAWRERSRKAQERIGAADGTFRRRLWRLVIRAGSSPVECTAVCPQPCKRQSPRQDRSATMKMSWKRIADRSEAQKSKPTHPRPSAFLIMFFLQAIGHPDKNQSGRMSGYERHVGPDRQ